MATTSIKGVWGVTKTLTKAPGIITDWEENNEAQTAYIQNEAGATLVTKVYDVKKTITCTVVQSADETAPDVGDTLSVDSNTYTILTVRLTQNNQSYAKYALTLEAWEAPKSE